MQTFIRLPAETADEYFTVRENRNKVSDALNWNTGKLRMSILLRSVVMVHCYDGGGCVLRRQPSVDRCCCCRGIREGACCPRNKTA